MHTKQYIETVFKSLEIAVEFGIIERWSIADSNFVIQLGGESTTIPSVQAADYLIELFKQCKADGKVAPRSGSQHARMRLAA